MRIIEFQNILKKYQDKYPVDVVEIAKEMEIKVWSVKDWGNNISGKIQKSEKEGGKSGYVIYVNAAHSAERNRFTIAHEIAHFYLHKDKIGDGVIDDGLYRSGLSNAVEIAANGLAADILMPAHLIKRAIDDNDGNYDYENLAKQFKVPNEAMAIRLGLKF